MKQLLAVKLLFYAWHTALVCAAFCLCEGRCEEGQQLYQRRALIFQCMFESEGYGNYLSIIKGYLCLIRGRRFNSFPFRRTR
jgi:hypothetical protein